MPDTDTCLDPAILQDAAWRLCDRLGLTEGTSGNVCYSGSQFFIYLRGPWMGETPTEFEGVPITWSQPTSNLHLHAA